MRLEWRHGWVGVALLLAIAVGCRQSAPQSQGAVRPSIAPPFLAPEKTPTSVLSDTLPSETRIPDDANAITIDVDVRRNVHPISPYIYGLSGGEGNVVEQIRPTLMSWGGNPSTRFNWRIGHAWNAARDWFYRNGNYGVTSGSASDDFVSGAVELGAAVRLALPTLGWVAKNDDLDTCSFPDENGECSDGQGASCDNPIVVATPERTSVASTPDDIVTWVRDMQRKGLNVQFYAMDNEPELWGFTHYDVHPECTTYQEILDKYLQYASAVRDVAPDAELTGPVTCCWYFYWNSAAGRIDKAAHQNQDFIPWFLENVREFDERTGQRTLDVLDIHYYPDGLYNDNVDEQTAAHRLRSTRSLWDASYVDESWIEEPVYLIPRMMEIIRAHYPGTKLGISEWNWGADSTMNGALAIADVLGIFGREGVHFAAYWRAPQPDTPGMYAFKMYTNYDDQDGRFGDTSVFAQSSDTSQVSTYAAVESATGNLHLMLINKQVHESAPIVINVSGFTPSPLISQYHYDVMDSDEIVSSHFAIEEGSIVVSLRPYSLTLLVLKAKDE